MRQVTLFGTLLESNAPGSIVFDVAPQLGDAPEFSLAGQLTFLERQLCSYTAVGHGRDVIIVPAHIAESKAECAGKRPPPKRRNR